MTQRTFPIQPENVLEGEGQLLADPDNSGTQGGTEASSSPTGGGDQHAQGNRREALRQLQGALHVDGPFQLAPLPSTILTNKAEAHETPHSLPRGMRSLGELTAHCEALAAFLRAGSAQHRCRASLSMTAEVPAVLGPLLASGGYGEAARQELLQRARAARAEADNWTAFGHADVARVLRKDPALPFPSAGGGADTDADDMPGTLKELAAFAKRVNDTSALLEQLDSLLADCGLLSPLLSKAVNAEADWETTQVLTSDSVLPELEALHRCVAQLTASVERSTETVRRNRAALQSSGMGGSSSARSE